MKEHWLNLPNVLTMLRIAAVPAVVWLIFEGEMTISLIVFLAAVLTDLLDGYIARKNNLITRLGMWLDPLADKLMAVGVLLAFFGVGIVPLHILAIIFAKEALMVVGAIIILRKEIDIPSDTFGKYSAFFLNFTIGLGFLAQTWLHIYTVVLHVAVAVVVASFVHYSVKNGRYILAKRID